MKDIKKRSSSKLCLRVCKISVVDKYMQANILAEKIAFIVIFSLLEYLLAYCIHCYSKGLEMLEMTSYL